MMLAQGDVLLVSVEKIPAGLKHEEDGVVARGEATGHAHRLVGDATLLRDPVSRALYIEAHGGTLVHEEHAPHRLEGRFRVVIQREYDGQYSRQVAD